MTCISGCEKGIDLNLNGNPNLLVINGFVTNGEGPHNISIRRTMAYSFSDPADEMRPVTGATVQIIDDLDSVTTLVEWSPGNYDTRTSPFEGQVGRSYRLNIFTDDGKHYVSVPELLRPVAPIENLYYTFSRNEELHYRVYVDFHEPEGKGDYYRWRFFIDGRLQIGIDAENDNFYDGKDIIRREVGGWDEARNNLPVQVQQLSLTKEAYNFWSTAKQQFQQADNAPYDTPPAPLFGNIYNADNPQERALGYFGASGVSSKKIMLETK
jgi:hypothetical protein